MFQSPFAGVDTTFRMPDRMPLELTPDDIIDCEGLLCPLPVLRARKRLLHMRPGMILSLRATDPMAAIDLPHFCAEAGHVLLSTAQEGAVQIYLIQRGPDKT